MKHKITGLTIVASALLVCAIPTFAQTGQSQMNASQQDQKNAAGLPGALLSGSQPIDGAVNCFDYYKFGSVSVDLQSDVSQTVSGVPLVLKGKITNNNSYPIVGGSVYVKVFKKQADQNSVHQNGYDLVDQFVAKDDVTLKANETKEISFTWNVPAYATSGDYQIATFFIQEDRFNLLGLSFTDDVVGNTFDFSVVGENKNGVAFEKNTVSVNDSAYHFAAFPPAVSDGNPANIKATLVNDTKEKQIVPVTWTLYSWDAQRKENVIASKTDTVQIEPGKKQDVSYAATDTGNPVYLLVASAKYQDTTSILDIRFTRDNVDKVRLNSVGLTNWPLQANQQDTVFVCVHNSGKNNIVGNNKLVLTLLDANQKEISSYTYTGNISGSVMGLKNDFIPKQAPDVFTLRTQLYTDNKIVDSVDMVYDCAKIDSTKCNTSANSAGQGGTRQGSPGRSIFVWIIVLVLIIGAITLVFIRRNKGSRINMFIFLLAATAFIFGAAGKSEAKTVQWTTGNISDMLNYHYNYNGGSFFSGWLPALSGVNASVTFGATLMNADTGIPINDGASVPVGTRIKFIPTPPADTDISWFGTGHSYDSPYGHWIANAASPSKKCDDADFTNTQDVPNYYFPSVIYKLNVYAPLSMNTPTVNVSFADPSMVSGCAGSPMVCTVAKTGSILATFTFSNTFGKFYYAYSPKGNTGNYFAPFGAADGKCAGTANNDPLRKNTDPQSLCVNGTFNNFANNCQTESSDYLITVPTQSITFSLIATVPNDPPNAPVINGPSSGIKDTQYAFSAVASDTNGDTLRYGFDWDRNGIVDQWIPAIGYVNSGTLQTVSRAWTQKGAMTFQVLAQDSKGGNSTWTQFSITIAAPCVPDTSCTSHTISWSGKCDGACGTTGTESGGCDNGCSGTGSAVRACSTQACPPLSGTWKEVAP